MSAQAKCPQCGTPLPPAALEGLCPACLLKQGAANETTLAPEQRFEPPPVSEVARLFPQLEIVELIGKGGMGAIYKARQPALDRIVALKILPPQTPGRPDFAERFNREARALARLSHPNIVGVHEFGQVDGLHYFLMEYVDGVNLRQLERAGQLSPREALQIVPQICDALQYAHDEGVVHRDIKPENVLVDRKGRVKIADFGLAKILGFEPSSLRLTGAGQVMGTPHYMAPEQIERPLEVDHRADIYALGVVFYEMLTGELPLGKFAPPSRKVQVDVRLDDIVLRALEKEPELRFQQASQVKTAVQTIAAAPDEAKTATPPSQPASIPRQDWWERIKNRIWPPLVGRRNGRRALNWPAFVMRGLRAAFVTIWFAVTLGVLVGLVYGPKQGLIAGVLYAVAMLILQGFVMTIRVLRGFAMPMNQLPELDPATGAAPPEPLSPADRNSLMRRALSAAASVFILVFGLAAIVTFILPEQYVSTTRIRVGKIGVPDYAALDPYFIQTEFEVIRSQLVLLHVVDQLNLTERWGKRYNAPAPVLPRSATLELLKKHLDIRLSPNTSLVEIRVFDEDKGEAAELANAIVDSYRAARPTSRAEVIDRAEPAWRPARPNIPLNLFLGAVAGLMVGSCAAGIVFLAKSRRLSRIAPALGWFGPAVVFTLLLAMAAGALFHGQTREPNVTVTGLVTDGATGQPIANALVSDKQLNPEQAKRGAPAVERPSDSASQQTAGSMADAILRKLPQLRFISRVDPDLSRTNIWGPTGAELEGAELDLARLMAGPRLDLTALEGGRDAPVFCFWFAHPAFDLRSECFVTLTDTNGGPIPLFHGTISSSLQPPGERSDTNGWFMAAVPLEPAKPVPHVVNVLLKYALGPWKDVQRIEPKPNHQQEISTEGGQITGMGETLDGRAFIGLARDLSSASSGQFEFEAETKNGLHLQPLGSSAGGTDKIRTQQFEFKVPIRDVKAFRLRTRPIEKMEYQNVSLGTATTATAVSEPKP